MLPKTLKIWGHKYKVLQQKDPRVFDGKNNPPVLGYFHANEHVICVKKSLEKRPSQQAEILLHELLHGVGYYSDTFDGILEKEETVICSLAAGLTLVLKDNPDLLDYLKESLNE